MDKAMSEPLLVDSAPSTPLTPTGEVSPQTRAICEMMTACVARLGDMGADASLTQLACAMTELQVMEQVAADAVGQLKGEQVSRHMGFGRRESAGSDHSLGFDVVQLDNAVASCTSSMAMLEGLILQRQADDAAHQDALRDEVGFNLDALLQGVSQGRGWWHDHEQQVAHASAMTTELLQGVADARSAFAQHTEEKEALEAKLRAVPPPPPPPPESRDTGSQTVPFQDPEVQRLHALLDSANSLRRAAQDELDSVLFQKQPSPVGRGAASLLPRPVLIDAQVEARAPTSEATTQAGGVLLAGETQTDYLGDDFEAQDRAQEALRVSAVEANERAAQSGVRLKAREDDILRLNAAITEERQQLAELREHMAHEEDRIEAAVQRMKAEIVPRLQGEICVMSARFKALLQQTGDAVAARTKAEAALEEHRSKGPQTPPPPCHNLAALQKKVADLQQENTSVIAQLGQYKNRSVQLSRYETRSHALSLELGELKATSAALQEAHRALTASHSEAEAELAVARQSVSTLQEERRVGLLTEARDREEIAMLQKNIEHMKTAEPDTRVLEGLRSLEDLSKMYHDANEELLRMKVSEAECAQLKDRNTDLSRDLEEANLTLATVAKEKDRTRTLEREAARVPVLKKKMEELRFVAEKAEWDKKVATTHFEEEGAKLQKTIDDLQQQARVLRGEVSPGSGDKPFGEDGGWAFGSFSGKDQD